MNVKPWWINTELCNMPWGTRTVLRRRGPFYLHDNRLTDGGKVSFKVARSFTPARDFWC
jgi:hypothetical protein